uniref:Uncharacterized protein n=1 Tax=Mola mola TaxID=94237 RepID=A0A3Q3W9Z9_MOLML
MKSLSVFVSLVPFLSLLLVLPAVSAGPACGPCDPASCAPLPAEGCLAGSLDENKKNKLGVCACKSNYEVCGTDGVTYRSGCALKSASLAAEKQGKEPINVENKGRCATGEPLIVTPPGEVYNVSGSQVYLSCEAVGVPTPVLTWKKVRFSRMELLPGDRDNLAIQTRGGPEKHEVTGWVLISPLTKEEEGSYECHASNSKGEASAVGVIHLVESIDDIVIKKDKGAQLTKIKKLTRGILLCGVIFC